MISQIENIGSAFCGIDEAWHSALPAPRPPACTQAHHIRWWVRDDGPTGLGNGILLCSFHHHVVHRDGWVIEIRDGRSWFVPPPHVDIDQRSRPGNRAARSLARGGEATGGVREAAG